MPERIAHDQAEISVLLYYDELVAERHAIIRKLAKMRKEYAWAVNKAHSLELEAKRIRSWYEERFGPVTLERVRKQRRPVGLRHGEFKTPEEKRVRRRPHSYWQTKLKRAIQRARERQQRAVSDGTN